MNIVQMHETVRFWLDMVRSPRYEPEEIDRSINIVIDKIVDEKYTFASTFHSSESFQKVQKVRDQLGKLVKRLSVLNGGLTLEAQTVSGERKISLINPDSFRHLLDFAIYAGEDKYPCFPTDYNHKNLLPRNPFRRPRADIFPKFYYTEEEGKFLVLQPKDVTITGAEIFVLKKQTDVKYGFEYGPSKVFMSGDKVIVAEKGTTYNDMPRNIGDVIEIGTVSSISSGMVVHGYSDSELSVTLHEEIARRAAVEMLRSTGQTEKSNLLLAEFKVG